ncbi:Haloacid dehalogenase-like hydrolase-domain-containing protein [Collybia nuda]|uniref:Haloacid dehalogenase-like hydrolase-domain-containing protein n=1 Tax=Collybia nuda TaxID=64659 RepID=A0A9P6CEC2_9AGAR|nr:Haloacid dehalogenase-like hydrolase-domain-containing protein [Collybia nuda]
MPVPHHSSYSTIIIGLNSALFKRLPQTDHRISPCILHAISQTASIWSNFVKGDLTEDDYYSHVAAKFKLDPKDVRQAFDQIRTSLRTDDDIYALLRELRLASQGKVQVLALVSTSTADYEALHSKPVDWSVFDQVFACSEEEKMPSLSFYRRILATTNLDPGNVIFIDDNFDSIFTARSLGMHSVVLKDATCVERALRNLLGNPIKRGQDFLRRNARHLDCITRHTDGYGTMIVHENWTQLLILEATNDRTLVDFVEHSGKWNFFKEGPQLTTDHYPDDLDTTSVGLTVLKYDKEIVDPILDEMLKYVNSDGILLTYFDHDRQRLDAGICVDILALFYAYGRGDEAAPTLYWIRDILQYKAYLEGTRYFNTPECFLWLVSRLLSYSDDAVLHATLKPLLKERVQEHIGVTGDALALAMRILVCDAVGICNETDLSQLLPLQCVDGGWEVGWIYHFPTAGVSIGNRGLTTALAIKAIEAVRGNAV